ncbi:MAG TPA: adenylate/guanylate cyclase domain-containing protein [Acidimicrobiales bacterium]|nr:adenylate/guanylate cyclase domain-containing protein [Acidimicrobiales bacterium]
MDWTRAEERRVVTVVFADLVGFTALAERLDPERVKRLIDGLFVRLSGDVAAFGGRVDKVLGDGMVALFGAPVAHEDDAERAVRAALRMQASLEQMSLPVPVKMRIGVNTGEVLVGSLRADRDYTALGDVVNTASRLQDCAPHGRVLVGPATYVATRDAIRYEQLGPVLVRGREEPVEAWLAVEPLQLPGRRTRPVQADLVGRDAELGLLLGMIRMSAESSRAAVAHVLGDGGCGKTRLVSEVVVRAACEMGATYLTGRCVPYGETNRWWPIADALGYLLDIDATESPDRDALAERLAERQRGTDDLLDGLCMLYGVPSPLDGIDPSRARQELTRVATALIGTALAEGPVVLTLGDTHWAHPHVLELVAEMLSRHAEAPLTVLTTARPGSEDPWPPTSPRGAVLTLCLQPLGRAASGRLVHALLGEVADEELVDALFARSGGNPLFLEELSSLIAEGTPEAMPDTLRALVAARLDQLPPGQRAILDNAAVLGLSGTWEMLTHFAHEMRQVADAADYAALAEAGLLEQHGNRWHFRSESVRDVAYQTITKAARAVRHAGVAEALESKVPAGTRLDEIADHWSTAAELASELGGVRSLRSDVAVRAVEALLALVDAAIDHLEPVAAGHAVRRARVLVPPEETRLRSRVEARDLLVQGELARLQTQIEEAETAFARAADLAVQLDEPAVRAAAERAWGFALVFSGAFDEAEVHLDVAGALYGELGDSRGQAWVEQHRAWISFVEGDAAEAETRLQAAARTMAELGDVGGLGWAMGLLAYVRFFQGQFQEAAELGREVEQKAAELGDRWAVSMMGLLRATLALWQGRLAEANELAEGALATFRATGDRFGQTQAMASIGRALVGLGRVGDAARVIEEATSVSRGLEIRMLAGHVAASAALVRGDGDRAYALAKSVVQEATSTGAAFDAAVTLGLAQVLRGEPEAALAVLEEADAGRPGRPSAHAAMALAHVSAGSPTAAREHAEAAFASVGATYLDLFQAALGLALALAQEGDGDAAMARLLETETAIDGTDDVASQALVRVAQAAILDTAELPGADHAREEVARLLAGTDLELGAWTAFVERAARPRAVASEVPG